MVGILYSHERACALSHQTHLTGSYSSQQRGVLKKDLIQHPAVQSVVIPAVTGNASGLAASPRGSEIVECHLSIGRPAEIGRPRHSRSIWEGPDLPSRQPGTVTSPTPVENDIPRVCLHLWSKCPSKIQRLVVAAAEPVRSVSLPVSPAALV